MKEPVPWHHSIFCMRGTFLALALLSCLHLTAAQLRLCGPGSAQSDICEVTLVPESLMASL